MSHSARAPVRRTDCTRCSRPPAPPRPRARSTSTCAVGLASRGSPSTLARARHVYAHLVQNRQAVRQVVVLLAQRLDDQSVGVVVVRRPVRHAHQVLTSDQILGLPLTPPSDPNEAGIHGTARNAFVQRHHQHKVRTRVSSNHTPISHSLQLLSIPHTAREHSLARLFHRHHTTAHSLVEMPSLRAVH